MKTLLQRLIVLSPKDRIMAIHETKEWLKEKLPKYGINGKSDDKFAYPEDVIKELIEELK